MLVKQKLFHLTKITNEGKIKRYKGSGELTTSSHNDTSDELDTTTSGYTATQNRYLNIF